MPEKPKTLKPKKMPTIAEAFGLHGGYLRSLRSMFKYNLKQNKESSVVKQSIGVRKKTFKGRRRN